MHCPLSPPMFPRLWKYVACISYQSLSNVLLFMVFIKINNLFPFYWLEAKIQKSKRSIVGCLKADSKIYFTLNTLRLTFCLLFVNLTQSKSERSSGDISITNIFYQFRQIINLGFLFGNVLFDIEKTFETSTKIHAIPLTYVHPIQIHLACHN